MRAVVNMNNSVQEKRMNYQKHIRIAACILGVQFLFIFFKFDVLAQVFLFIAVILIFVHLFHKISRTGHDSTWRLMDYPDDVFEQLCRFYTVSIFVGAMVSHFIMWFAQLWKTAPLRW